MIYIASPYAHKSITEMRAREEVVAKYTAALMSQGKNCFSPIVHGHRLQDFLPEDKRTDNRFWLRHNFEMLMLASELHVLQIQGWERSKGIQFEVNTAQAITLPTHYIDMEAAA